MATENNSTLLVAVIKELAVALGKRKVDGEWIDSNP